MDGNLLKCEFDTSIFFGENKLPIHTTRVMQRRPLDDNTTNIFLVMLYCQKRLVQHRNGKKHLR